MELREHLFHQPGFFGERPQIGGAAHFAIRQAQQCAIKAVVEQIVFARPLVLQILLGLATLHFVERRLGDVEMAALDQVRHLPEEEGEQQGANMGAVDVGVRHDDDLVIAQLGDVEIIAADAGAQSRDQRADFLRRQHFVETRAFDIQDLAAQRQHRLIFAVAALFGRATGRVTLDDEQFRLGGIAFLAVGELAGQVGDIERAFAARQLARLARRFAGKSGFHHFGDDRFGFLRMFLEPLAEHFVDQAFDHRPHFRGDELVFRLRREFRVGHFHRQHAGQALAAIVAGEIDLFLLGDAGGFGIAGDLARQRGAEAGEMRAAVALRNVVGEGQHVLVVAVVPPQRHFHRDTVALAADQDRCGDLRLLGAVEIAHESLEAAFVEQFLDLRLGMARVGQHDAHARIQEGQFTQTMFDRRVIELDHREGFGRRRECHFGAALRPAVDLRCRSDDGQRRHHVAVREADDMFLAVAPDAQFQRSRQRVDDGDADAVQTAGDLVGILVELTARMQLGHDDLGRRHAFFRVNVGGNATAVVGHGTGAVGIERHGDERRMTGERFVDGIVDDFVDHVMQARTIVGVADVHARPFAHRIEATKDLDGISAIGCGIGIFGGLGHEG